LRPDDDYAATDGVNITLVSAATAGDELVVDAFGNFLVADTYSKAQTDALIGAVDLSSRVAKSGDTMTGDLQMQTSNELQFWTTSYGIRAYSGLEIKTGDMVRFLKGTTEQMRIDSAGRVTMPYQPAFKVGRTTGHVSATTTVVFNAVIFNTGNHYNASNGAFTTPIAGRYLFTTGLFSVSGTSVYTEIRVNGSHVAWTIYTGSGYGTANHSVILNLNANDTVTVVVSGGQLYAGGSSSDCYFSGTLLG
jgi:hypothetical protein